MSLGFQRQGLWCRGIFSLSAQVVCNVLAWLSPAVRNCRWKENGTVSWATHISIILSLTGDVQPWGKGVGCCTLNVGCPHRLMCVKTWVSCGGAVWEKSGAFSRWNLAGGSKSLQRGRASSLWAWHHFLFIPSVFRLLTQYDGLAWCFCYYAFPAMMDCMPSGTVSQSKYFLF